MEKKNDINEVIHQIETKRIEQELARGLKENKDLQDAKYRRVEDTLDRLEEGMRRHEERSMKVQEEIKTDLKDVKSKLSQYDTRFAKLDTTIEIVGSILRYSIAPFVIGTVLLVLKAMLHTME